MEARVTWTWGIEKGQNYNGSAGWQVQRMNTGHGQATGMWFARPGTSHTRRTGTWGMDARTDTKIITMRYDGASTNLKFYANGSYQTQHTSIVRALYPIPPKAKLERNYIGVKFYLPQCTFRLQTENMWRAI